MKGSSGFWILSVLFFFMISETTFVHGKNNKVKLKDVEVLTLVEGRMTTGRRSSPVPQFTCIGSSSTCNAFVPNIIQCYNRGSDGVDVQWECKAEMDNNYRFGKVEVTCEGYDYPDDPYILAGSCGLEYTIERIDGSGKSYSRDEYYDDKPKYNTKQSSNTFGTLMLIGVVAVALYAFYKTCIAPNEHMNARSRTNDDFSGRQPPPPPGFRQDYFPNSGSGGNGGGGGGGFFGGTSNDYGDSCGAGTRPNYQGTRTAGANLPGAGGFWTGAATGGLLGYMFGGRNNDGGRGGGGWTGGQMPRTTPSGSGGWAGGSSGAGSSSGSSGSRTASGFGGTKRR